jgi:hypothetical protein
MNSEKPLKNLAHKSILNLYATLISYDIQAICRDEIYVKAYLLTVNEICQRTASKF